VRIDLPVFPIAANTPPLKAAKVEQFLSNIALALLRLQARKWQP